MVPAEAAERVMDRLRTAGGGRPGSFDNGPAYTLACAGSPLNGVEVLAFAEAAGEEYVREMVAEGVIDMGRLIGMLGGAIAFAVLVGAELAMAEEVAGDV